MGQLRLFKDAENKSDIVYTPDFIARQIVEHFKPSGRVLEPCKGDGAFLRYLPGAEYCEITEGKDFFAWDRHVDWIIGNPPYSILTEWMQHSFSVARDIVYFVPLHKMMSVWRTVEVIAKNGGFVEAYVLGPGRAVGFDFGYTVGAVHVRREYQGEMKWTFAVIDKPRRKRGRPRKGE